LINIKNAIKKTFPIEKILFILPPFSKANPPAQTYPFPLDQLEKPLAFHAKKDRNNRFHANVTMRTISNIYATELKSQKIICYAFH
jgi:hypothetical protein